MSVQDAAALRIAFNRAAESFPRHIKMPDESRKELMLWWEKFYGAITTNDAGLEVTAEIARLKRGEFTPEEFQNLCHHRDEKSGCTRADFEKGCVEYQNLLFGSNT